MVKDDGADKERCFATLLAPGHGISIKSVFIACDRSGQRCD